MESSQSFVVRRSESVDAQSISKLVKRATENVFGRINVEYIIEKANLAISLSDTGNHEILGHMALLDYPNTAGVDHAEWEVWMEDNFECRLASAVNSLFLHLFVASEGYHQGASAEILHTVFMAVPLLQYVFLTVPHGTNLGLALEVHFIRVPVKDGATPTHDLYVTHRHRHVPVLHTRTARVEDADDLTPVFRQCSTNEVNKQYGEYFLAELIESQDEDHKTIVAEVNGRAVGFVSVSTEVDVELLNTCFQLDPFHGLKVLPSEVSEQESEREAPESLQPSSVKISDKEVDAAQLKSSASIHKSVTSMQKSTTSMQKSTTSMQQKSTAMLQKSTTSMQQKSTAMLQKSTTSMQQKSTAMLQKSTTSMQQKSTAMLQKSTASMQQKSTAMLQKSTASMQQKSTAMLQKSTASMHKSSTTSIGGGPKSLTASQTDVGPQSNTQKVPTLQQSLVTMTEPKSGMLQSTASIASATGDRERKTSQLLEKESPEPSAARPRQGGCSAVAIQLFAINEQYEMRSIDFLPAIFKLFPEHDFCILTQPHNLPEFPLLTHFTRVNPRVGTTLPQELYVFHKCALLHSFAVRRVTPSDLSAIEKLVSGLEGAETVLRDVKRYVDGRRDPIEEGATPIFAAVAVCVEQVVGVAVLRQDMDIGYIRSHYNIEDFVYFNYHRPEEHGHLNHFILNPVFAPYTKHFIKELLRLSHKSCLYHPLYTSSPEGHTVISALGDMVPIRHRRQITYQVDSLGENAPLEEVLGKREPFALYHTNRKLTLEPKIPVNSRAVIVGASDTAIALLEQLVLSPHLRFNNITLVSPHGLSCDHTNKCLPESCCYGGDSFPLMGLKTVAPSYSCCYGGDSFPLMGLKTWVNTVKGKMVAIDRPDQHIVVEDGSGAEALVQYDYLVLCTGTQYCLPVELAATENVFTVRDEHEGARVLTWAKEELIPSGGSLVVYGSGLSSYTMIAALHQCGVEPSQLVLVQPRAGETFNNPMVEERVQGTLQEMGVAVYTGYTLEGWTEGEGLQLKGAEPLTLECKGLVYLEEKHVDREALKAMNDACLVFDRRLVIDGDSHTSDPLIFAAGPLTKFSRQYRADQWTHANFNSKEVGQKLASSLLSKLDPTADSSECDRVLIPTFSQPKTTAATLPGGVYYLHVEKPNLGESLQTLMEQPDYGQELITDTDNGYFRLHVNRYSRVQTITVLSKHPLEVTNYLCLYGLHEKYLNNLLSRYSEKLITDLFSYFREPWTCAVFHDRFPDFLEEVREYLQSPMESDAESFEDKVMKLVEEDSEVSIEKHRAKLAAEFEGSSVKNTIRKRLFHFLHYNSHHLPMYAKPDMI